MKDDDSAFLPLPYYISGFLGILLIWALSGPIVTEEMLYVLQRSGLDSSPLHLYFAQHLNFIILLLLELFFILRAERKRLRDFLFNEPPLFLRRFFLGGGIWLLSLVLYIGTQNITTPGQIIPYSGEGSHLIMILLALVLTPIQIFSEEILFRSFFFRGFRGTRVNRHIVSLISGTAFCAAHAANLEMGIGNSPFPVILYYFLSGFLFMELTYSWGGIAVTSGAHFINNFFIAVIVNYQNSSIFSIPFFHSGEQNIYLDLLILIVTCAVLLIMAENRKPSHSIDIA